MTCCRLSTIPGGRSVVNESWDIDAAESPRPRGLRGPCLDRGGPFPAGCCVGLQVCFGAHGVEVKARKVAGNLLLEWGQFLRPDYASRASRSMFGVHGRTRPEVLPRGGRHGRRSGCTASLQARCAGRDGSRRRLHHGMAKGIRFESCHIHSATAEPPQNLCAHGPDAGLP